MKKNSSKGYFILGILFILVGVIAFAVPTAKTAAFWISYAFTVIAFAAQLIIWKAALGRSESLKSKFLGLPVLHIGIVYLVVQVVALIVFLSIPTLPIWSAVVACAVIAGISAVCMIASDVGRGEIDRVSAKVQEKTFYIRELQADVEMLEEQEQNPEIKISLTKLTEKIRYSDPMSNVALADLEDRIREKVTALRTADYKLEIIAELDLLLAERNRKAKILK